MDIEIYRNELNELYWMLDKDKKDIGYQRIIELISKAENEWKRFVANALNIKLP